MKWYHYVAAFFAGMFLFNAIPHLVQGISGQPFPTPFADPPGKGLSTATVNVLWGLSNALIGYILLRASRLTNKNKMGLVVFFIGIAAVSITLSITFS